MNFQTLQTVLSDSSAIQIRLGLDDGSAVPDHFHVTEVGRVRKDFVDCGGVRREAQTCVLQTLVADDLDHRLSPSKLGGILDHAAVLRIEPETEVEIEVQGRTIGTYAVQSAETVGTALTLHLASKQTQCLAPDQCGLPTLGVVDQGCCGGNGSCE